MNSVLVVDDDESYRELIMLTLEDHCGVVEVHGFAGGATLLRHLDTGGCTRIGLALLDLHMPGMDGLALISEIRQRCPGLPVVLLSGAACAQEREACLAAGAIAFLEKPTAYADLIRSLADLVRSVAPLQPGGSEAEFGS